MQREHSLWSEISSFNRDTSDDLNQPFVNPFADKGELLVQGKKSGNTTVTTDATVPPQQTPSEELWADMFSDASIKKHFSSFPQKQNTSNDKALDETTDHLVSDEHPTCEPKSSRRS